jgi:hypothetical protein
MELYFGNTFGKKYCLRFFLSWSYIQRGGPFEMGRHSTAVSILLSLFREQTKVKPEMWPRRIACVTF